MTIVISAKPNFISFCLSFQLVKMILNLHAILHFINDFLCYSVLSTNCIDECTIFKMCITEKSSYSAF